MPRFKVKSEGGVTITGWSATAKQAGERAALYLSTGSTSMTITDTNPDRD